MNLFFKIFLSLILFVFGQTTTVIEVSTIQIIRYTVNSNVFEKETNYYCDLLNSEITRTCNFAGKFINYWKRDARSLATAGSSFSKYTKVDDWIKGITNATSKADIENIIKNWSDDLLSKLDN